MKYRLFEQMMKDFTKNEVEPFAQEVDEREAFPEATVKKMGELGLMGLIVPVKYGGAGGDYRMYLKAVEILSAACATTGVILSAHTSLCVAPILEHGSEAQKQQYLPDLCSGKKLGAFGLTEPNAGTDASNQQTTAELSGEHYVLNGSKLFITNAGYADVYVIIAVTGKNERGAVCSAFVVEKDYPGFSVGKKELKLGIRGSATCELIFKDCKVPKANLLGKEGAGLKIALKTLDGGRTGIAAQALGIAQGAMDAAVAYVQERKQFNKPLSAFQNTRFVVADMHTKIAAARALVSIAADAKDSGKEIALEAAHAKLFASEAAMDITTKAVQLFGGYGYSREYPVERMMRDAKITEIYEGTSEVQRMVISSEVFRK